MVRYITFVYFLHGLDHKNDIFRQADIMIYEPKLPFFNFSGTCFQREPIFKVSQSLINHGCYSDEEDMSLYQEGWKTTADVNYTWVYQSAKVTNR